MEGLSPAGAGNDRHHREEAVRGIPFTEVILRFQRWTGEEPAAILTWSQTDLHMLEKTAVSFYGTERIPFCGNTPTCSCTVKESWEFPPLSSWAWRRPASLLSLDEEEGPIITGRWTTAG